MTTAPLSPERLAEIAKLHAASTRDGAWIADAWIERLERCAAAIPKLLAEIRRLQSAVDRLANAERDVVLSR